MNNGRYVAYYLKMVCNGTPSRRCWCMSLDIAKTFTFSAKEKDQETGFSVTSLRSVSSSSLSQSQTSLAWHSLIRRFGSRYYSSDLSIWLSVDPQASKYPSLSPYVYCANNPIKLVDPNGEEIVISQTTDEKGNKVINISFSAKIVNKSSTAINGEKLQSYSNRISEAIQNYYSGTKENCTIVNVDMNIKTYSFDENLIVHPVLLERGSFDINTEFNNIFQNSTICVDSTKKIWINHDYGEDTLQIFSQAHILYYD